MAELAPEQRASYAAIIDDILRSSDINSVSAKAVRKGMQERIGYDITPQKAAITTLILERFDKFMPAAQAAAPAPKTNGHSDDPARKRKAEADAGSSELSDVDSEPAPKKVKKSKGKPEADSDEAFAAKLQAQFNAQARSTRGGGLVKKKSPVKRDKKPKKKSAAKVGSDLDSDVEGGASDAAKERKGGFHKLMNLSAPLAELVGEPALSRPQTVKKIWEYVKARDLQDPADKRQIRCDEKLQAVFKSDRVHMFTMNKILATHLYPVEE